MKQVISKPDLDQMIRHAEAVLTRDDQERWRVGKLPSSIAELSDVDIDDTTLHFEIYRAYMPIISMCICGVDEKDSIVDGSLIQDTLFAISVHVERYCNQRVYRFLKEEKPEDRTFDNYCEFWDLGYSEYDEMRGGHASPSQQDNGGEV